MCTCSSCFSLSVFATLVHLACAAVVAILTSGTCSPWLIIPWTYRFCGSWSGTGGCACVCVFPCVSLPVFAKLVQLACAVVVAVLTSGTCSAWLTLPLTHRICGCYDGTGLCI